VVLRLGNRATTCVLFQPKPNAFDEWWEICVIFATLQNSF
jgi:hypothetical protein